MTLTNKEGWPACLSDLCDCIKDAIFICIFSVIVIKFQCKSQVKLILLETSFFFLANRPMNNKIGILLPKLF